VVLTALAPFRSGVLCQGRHGAYHHGRQCCSGYLNPQALTGGTVRSRAIFRTRLCTGYRLARMDVLETAYGIHRLVNSTMMRAVKAVSTYRGPRSAGLHAVRIWGQRWCSRGGSRARATDAACDCAAAAGYLALSGCCAPIWRRYDRWPS